MDLSSVVDSLASGTYAVTRRAAGSVTNGIYTPGGTTTLSVKASVQPVQPEEVQRLPEGTRINDAKAVYSAFPLKAASEAGGTPGDLITIEGAPYEVVAVKDWGPLGNVCQALVQRVDP